FYSCCRRRRLRGNRSRRPLDDDNDASRGPSRRCANRKVRRVDRDGVCPYRPGEDAGSLEQLGPARADTRTRADIMGKLDGKVAIVTGAARGLGRAYARRLAGLGAKVAVSDINLRSYEEFAAEKDDMTGESTVAEIVTAGGSAIGIELDVGDREAVE